MTSSEDFLIEIKDLTKLFEIKKGLLGRNPRYLHALDSITFDIKKGEIFALAGESGCGKTTCGKLLLRLLEKTSGEIFFEKKEIFSLKHRELFEFRRKAHMIYQNPYESFDPRYTVKKALEEPLRIHKIRSKDTKIETALEIVGLAPAQDFLDVYLRELSGGQKQRVSIARGLVLEPEFIVADEPVSMLDVSIRASILDLLLDIRKRTNVTYIFITHDLSSARYLADRLAIMYLGNIVELGPVERIVNNPLHPYSKALISAVPVPDPMVKRSIPRIKGTIPTPIDLPSGCAFFDRCYDAKQECKEKRPSLIEVEKDHLVACNVV